MVRYVVKISANASFEDGDQDTGALWDVHVDAQNEQEANETAIALCTIVAVADEYNASEHGEWLGDDPGPDDRETEF